MSQDEDLRKTVGMLALAVSQLFEWATLLENSGVAPKGSLDSAREEAERTEMIREIRMIELLLEEARELDSHTLLRRLRERLYLLKSRVPDLHRR